MRQFTFAENLSMAWQCLTRYRSIERFTSQSLEEIEAFQLQAVRSLVDLAYHHTEFYHRKYAAAGIHPSDIRTWEDFQRIPTLTKDEVFKHGLEMVVDNRRIEDLIVSRSSGSTGRFISIYLDAQSFIDQELQVIRMLKSFYPEYGPRDKEVLIYTSEYPFNSIFGQYSVKYVHNLSPVADMVEAIIRHEPTIVAAYPSILREIARQYGDRCKSLGLKALLTNSEHSTQADRDALAEDFNCLVFDEYSSEELSSIAWQCSSKNYHLVPDSSYIEILDPERDIAMPTGSPGEVVGTCLVNRAMPFIRYRQADIAVMSDQQCTCGNHARRLEEISGRKNSSFKVATTGEIPSGRILDWTYNLVLADELDIEEFQVRQKTFSEVVITLVPGDTYNAATDSQKVANSFKKTFGQMFNVNVDLVSHIKKTRTGKHIPILSEVRNGS